MKNKKIVSKNPIVQSMLKHLAEETIPPEKIDLWPLLQASLAASKTLSKRKEFFVNKRIVLPAFAAVIVLTLVAVLIARNVTPVSAESILDKAYAAQTQSHNPLQGIAHIRNEIYSNYQARPKDQGMDTIIDSYLDLQSGNFRNVTIDTKTGRVLDALAYDGSNTYSQDYSEQNANSNAPLTIYRTPQRQVADLKPRSGDQGNVRALFDQMRKDPNVKLIGKETWSDGRTVYVLQSRQQVKAMLAGQKEFPLGWVTAYFDVSTYEQLGYRMTMEKDGQEIVLGSQKVLANEVLPAGAHIAWDLSDLQGIHLVDDPNREHGDLLPEVVTPQEAARNAAAKNQTVYLLKALPEGYALEISAPPRQAAEASYIYIASYRSAENNFVMQSASLENVADWKAGADEIYTTASGLVIMFNKDLTDSSSGKTYVDALVQAPDGTTFTLGSTLPRETVKAWAEELVPVK